MFNLSKTKEHLNKLTNRFSLGVLGAVAAIVPQAAESQERQIEEVVVSATKKDESASDIPLTVTALTEETLKEMNVTNFDEYIEYLPNVTSAGRGPGQSTIYIRGMAVDPVNVFLSAAQGSSPNVALYLDEQPLQVPGRNLDVYVVDMERIEVLPGPQGTLYGASSQAGTVRMITNKPKFNTTEAGFNTSVFNTHGGDISNSYDMYFNVPLAEDAWAIRGVFYNSQKGGYIDNVAGTWSGAGRGSFPAAGAAAFVEDNNSDLVEDNFNDSEYDGFRLSSAMSFGDDWDLLVTHVSQDITADGVFDYDPAKGDLKVSRFIEDTLEDSFSQTSMTLEGRIGKLDALYTGAYLDRESTQTVDYSGYANVGAWLPYYVCNAYDYTSCGSATVQVDLADENDRTTHEFRISSNELMDSPFSFTAGIFLDDSELVTRNNYGYLGTLSDAANNGTYGGYGPK
jgi:outer membrane receptor protein involved in Fe transport